MEGAAAPIIRDAERALEIAASAKTVAVLGCKTENQASQPAFYVPEALQGMGVKVVPVLVYYPDVITVLGEQVVRDLRQIKEQVDILDVFRRPQDLPGHVDDILAMDPRPACVWLQSGISNAEVEQRLAEEGIPVVVSRCLMVDRRAAQGRRSSL